MITMEQALKIKDELLLILDEDASNREKILERFETIKKEKGTSPYSALLLILTHLPFEENEAKNHWESILKHREMMSEAANRDIGLRVALFDYFINLNKKIENPRIIELSMFERMDRSSITDSLTGLPNLRFFMNSVSSEIRRSKRYNLKCSILLLDLDDFKRINDEHGDLVADIILKEASIIIRNNVRDIDLVCRYGGEEFAVILPETLRVGAYIVAERIRHSIEKHFQARDVCGTLLNLTISGGISLFPEDGLNTDEVIRRGLEALYQAKASGKNKVNAYFQEKRNFIRFDIIGDYFRLDIMNEAEDKEKAWESRWVPETRNISRSGILFKSDRLFQIGEMIEVSLLENDGEELISLHGRVVRVEELGYEEKGKFEIGVAFIMEWEDQEQKLLTIIERFRKFPGQQG
ncbi:MAG: diguanylate cyclase [Acidobacteriota bacterium]